MTPLDVCRFLAAAREDLGNWEADDFILFCQQAIVEAEKALAPEDKLALATDLLWKARRLIDTDPSASAGIWRELHEGFCETLKHE